MRLTLTDVHQTLLTLAGYVNADLQGWLIDHSRVLVMLAGCPLPSRGRLLI